MGARMFDPGTMRKRFAELGAKREAILAQARPLREARDAFAAETDAKLKAMAAEIKKAEAGLFEIEQERAIISRALSGKTRAA